MGKKLSIFFSHANNDIEKEPLASSWLKLLEIELIKVSRAEIILLEAAFLLLFFHDAFVVSLMVYF